MIVDCNWCALDIADDGYSASICIHNNIFTRENTVNENLIRDFLSAHGITFGIDENAIASMVNPIVFDRFIPVAKGIAAVRGLDGHFEFKKNMQDMKKKPLILENGVADYKNSLSLAVISQGELLAVYIPATKGSSGMDIYGKIIPSLGNGKDIPALRGRGITADENNLCYYAEYSGHIVMDGNKIYIDKLYTVNGDLDIEIGNIRFDGDVEINGDVRSGMEIEAKGNVFVHGHVGGCKIKSGKSITINKGIQGRGVCVLDAKEDVVCKFVESCTILAGNNIYADSVLSSNLTAQNQVLVTSKHGNVISSEVYGMAGVIVKEAGNDAGIPTLLKAGLPREYYTRAVLLEKTISEIDTKLLAFNRHLEKLDKFCGDKEDESIAETRKKITRAKIVLVSNKKEYSEELNELRVKIDSDIAHSYINVTDIVHSGVRIYIGTYPYYVIDSVKEVSFSIKNREIVVSPLES